MIRRLVWTLPLVLLVASSARAGAAGPQVVVGVGTDHHVAQVRVSSAGGALLYQGKPTSTPHSGYIRLYPIFFGLPGLPGRFFPATGTLCFDPPSSGCTTLPTGARQALSPLGRLPLRTHPLTTVRALYHGRTRLRLGNLAVAIELAIERGGRTSPLPSRAIPLRLVWKGPARATRPTEVRIGRRRGLYGRGRLYPLSASAVTNLRNNI